MIEDEEDDLEGGWKPLDIARRSDSVMTGTTKESRANGDPATDQGDMGDVSRLAKGSRYGYELICPPFTWQRIVRPLSPRERQRGAQWRLFTVKISLVTRGL